VARGVPTAASAEPLVRELSTGAAWVWPDPVGPASGLALTPFYAGQVRAALANPHLHECLALVDALRVLGARGRTAATAALQARLAA
jgi:hypothetical protein